MFKKIFLSDLNVIDGNTGTAKNLKRILNYLKFKASADYIFN